MPEVQFFAILKCSTTSVPAIIDDSLSVSNSLGGILVKKSDYFSIFLPLKLGRPIYFKVLISFSLFLFPVLVKIRVCCFVVVPFP